MNWIKSTAGEFIDKYIDYAKEHPNFNDDNYTDLAIALDILECNTIHYDLINGDIVYLEF